MPQTPFEIPNSLGDRTARQIDYRADIDGLRAVAIMAVLLCHARVPGFSGGFIGVDIFFVISGYLITSILMAECATENLSFSRFYVRRARRIVPALLATMIATTVAGAFILDPESFAKLGLSIAATALSSSNILFWREAGYFDPTSLEKPLLHTWSLSVEEQFYLTLPLLIFNLYGRPKTKHPSLLLLILLIASLFTSIYGLRNHSWATFYLAPTRSWELLTGAILAIHATRNGPAISAPAREAFSIAGLAIIALCIIFYNDNTPFPGATAIPPVLGATLIIAGGTSDKRPITNRILSTSIPVFIGKISYSLYLWHWPIIAYWNYLLFRDYNLSDSIAILIASFGISVASWHFIEKPFRVHNPATSNRSALILAGTAVAISAMIGISIWLSKGLEWRISPQVLQAYRQAKDFDWDRNLKCQQAAEAVDTGALPERIGSESAEPTFAIVGDSHAYALTPMLDREARDRELAGYVITRNNTPFLIGYSKTTHPHDDGFNEAAHNSKIVRFLQTNHNIRIVIIAGRWGSYTVTPSTVTGTSKKSWHDFFDEQQAGRPVSSALAISDGLERAIRSIHQPNRKVFIVTDVPDHEFDIPKTYLTLSRWPILTDLESTRTKLSRHNLTEATSSRIITDLEIKLGVGVIRTESLMFDSDGLSMISHNGNLLYSDKDHLSPYGALYLAPLFEILFAPENHVPRSNNLP